MKRWFTRAPNLWNIVFLLTLAVYGVGLLPDIMEPDAAVYAEVSMEMHDSGDFLSIHHKQKDWLDKPHFPFWMSAISYRIFGVNTIAYKLPAVFFVLLGAWYTYLFGVRFYSRMHGFIAALLLLTAEHIIISNQDVRAEPFMTGLLIMALYHLARFVSLKPPKEASGWPHLVFGAFALACLMMTKGLFTVIPVAAGVGLTLLYGKHWQRLLDWRWLVLLVLVTLFLFPALLGYYQQFDLHPEKEIFGRHGVSGVEFFLWASQWGRFTNTGPIKGSGDVTFFIHTMLWAFLPWAFAAFYALFVRTRQLVRRTAVPETFSYFGFITLFIIFSLSKFQLSFYLNPLFPLLSIITADVLLRSRLRVKQAFATIHAVLCILLLMGLFALHYFFLNSGIHADTTVVLGGSIALGLLLFAGQRNQLKKIVFGTALIVLCVNYYVNREFYPALMKYQAESQAAHYMRARDIAADQITFVGEVQSVADILLHHVTPVVSIDSVKVRDVAGRYVFTSPEGVKKLDSLQMHYVVDTVFQDFPVTRLTGKFINRRTRAGEVTRKLLLKVAN